MNTTSAPGWTPLPTGAQKRSTISRATRATARCCIRRSACR